MAHMRFSHAAETPSLSRVVRMERSQAELLATLLSRAFHNEPSVTYILPDEPARRAMLPWFYSVALRASQHCGEVYTTTTLDGAALWVSPGLVSTFSQIIRTAMQDAPFKLEPSSLSRWIHLSAHMERICRRLAGAPHWYLMSLGVAPSKPETTISGALIEPVISRADAHGLSCYLETFRAENLSFYQEYGFRIEAAGRIPKGGPEFWAMIRA